MNRAIRRIPLQHQAAAPLRIVRIVLDHDGRRDPGDDVANLYIVRGQLLGSIPWSETRTSLCATSVSDELAGLPPCRAAATYAARARVKGPRTCRVWPPAAIARGPPVVGQHPGGPLAGRGGLTGKLRGSWLHVSMG